MLNHIKPKGKKRLGGLDPEARFTASNMSLGVKAPQEKRFISSVASWRKPLPPRHATAEELAMLPPLPPLPKPVSAASWRKPPPKKVSAPVIESDDEFKPKKAKKKKYYAVVSVLEGRRQRDLFFKTKAEYDKYMADCAESSDSEDDQPLSKRQKQEKEKEKKQKKPYATVGHQDGNGREWDEDFWTKAEYEAYKKRSDERIRASQAKMLLPNRGEPPDYVVGEKVFYENALVHVCVKRVWINKEAMDNDVQPLFRYASQIAVEYHMEVAACEYNNRSKINVKHYNHNAWYEIIWYDKERMRQIVPQCFLRANRDPHQPREMVTEERPGYCLPKPSEWYKFAADYDSDAEAEK